MKNVFIHRKSSGYEKLLQGFLTVYGMLRSTDLHKQIQTLALLKKLPVAQSRYFAHSYTLKKFIPLSTIDRHYALTLKKILSGIRGSHHDKCKTSVMGNVTPCSPVETNTRFEKNLFCYSATLNIEVPGPPSLRPPKYRKISTRKHGVPSQKTVIFTAQSNAYPHTLPL